MSIPNYQYFMLPVLKAAGSGTVSISDIIETIANEAHINRILLFALRFFIIQCGGAVLRIIYR